MKKLICVLLTLALLLSVLPAGLPALAEEPEFEIDGTTLVKYNGDAEEVVVPDGIEVLGDWAFYNTRVRKVVLPDTLTTIRSYCFFDCGQLEEMTLPASVSDVNHSQVFEACVSLKAFSVAEGNEAYKAVDGVLFTKNGTDLVFYPCGREADVYEIPQGTRQIYPTAFSSPRIRKIVIPASLIYMEQTELSTVQGLKEIEAEEGSPLFLSRDGVLCSPDGKTVLCYPGGRQDELTAADFPEGIECIGEAALANCEAVSIVLPDTVRKVDWRAFAGSRVLQTVVLPASVEEIGGRAFENCRELKMVVFLNENTAIDTETDASLNSGAQDPVVIAPPGGAVEAYCIARDILFCPAEWTGEKTPEQAADLLAQLGLDQASAEAAARQGRLAAREKEFREELDELIAEQQQADAEWAAAWPPEGKTEATQMAGGIRDRKEFRMDFTSDEGLLSGFSPASLSGDAAPEKEPVTEYHVTFLSGDDHLRGLLYQGIYGGKKDAATLGLSWKYVTAPGAARYRIDMASEHYWFSRTVRVEVRDVDDVTVTPATGDVYLPVGMAIQLPQLYKLEGLVTVEPACDYECDVVAYEDTLEQTDDWKFNDGEFTAFVPGDYPLTLRITAGTGPAWEFPIMVHVTEEITEPMLGIFDPG